MLRPASLPFLTYYLSRPLQHGYDCELTPLKYTRSILYIAVPWDGFIYQYFAHNSSQFELCAIRFAIAGVSGFITLCHNTLSLSPLSKSSEKIEQFRCTFLVLLRIWSIKKMLLFFVRHNSHFSKYCLFLCCANSKLALSKWEKRYKHRLIVFSHLLSSISLFNFRFPLLVDCAVSTFFNKSINRNDIRTLPILHFPLCRVIN